QRSQPAPGRLDRLPAAHQRLLRGRTGTKAEETDQFARLGVPIELENGDSGFVYAVHPPVTMERPMPQSHVSVYSEPKTVFLWREGAAERLGHAANLLRVVMSIGKAAVHPRRPDADQMDHEESASEEERRQQKAKPSGGHRVLLRMRCRKYSRLAWVIAWV